MQFRGPVSVMVLRLGPQRSKHPPGMLRGAHGTPTANPLRWYRQPGCTRNLRRTRLVVTPRSKLKSRASCVNGRDQRSLPACNLGLASLRLLHAVPSVTTPTCARAPARGSVRDSAPCSAAASGSGCGCCWAPAAAAAEMSSREVRDSAAGRVRRGWAGHARQVLVRAGVAAWCTGSLRKGYKDVQHQRCAQPYDVT